MGISYLEFAVAQPAIFRLMFGELKKARTVDDSSDQCLKNVIDEVAYYSRKHGHIADAQQIALRLWTFVHGASSLELDGDYEHVAPGLDVRALIADATPRLLGFAPEKRSASPAKKR
ncbi:MAG: TetR-like C-terminal domain-containing protein [Hyphomicrobium sp.]